MRRPNFAFTLVPRIVALISIVALAGCGSSGGSNQDSGAGGQTGSGGSSGIGGHTGSGGSGSGGSGSGGAGVTDSGTDLPKADAGSGGATGAGGGTGGQMDAAPDVPSGAGGAGMGGGGGEDASADAPVNTGTGGGAGGDMDAGSDAAGGADGGADTGPPTSATGVETVSVPLTAAGQGQRYNVQNRTTPDMPYNLSGQTLTIRAYAPGAVGGDMSVFFRSSIPVDGAATGAVDSAPTKVALSSITSGFIDVQIPVPAAAGGFDPSMVDIIRIEIEADANFGTTFQTPATIVYFDSIISSNGAVMLPFDAAAGGNDFASSGARPLTNSTGPTFLATFP